MPPELSTTQRDVTQSLHRSHGSFELAFAPLLMALGGLWIDRQLDLVPVFTLVLALLGVLGVFAKIYYSYRYTMAQLDAKGAWSTHAGEDAS